MLDPRPLSLRVWLMWGLLAANIAGCSGGSFTLFPAGDFLLQETKEVRRAVPPSVPAPRELEKTVLPPYLVQPGDTLLVEPVALDSALRFPADQTVLPDGTIDLGRFGKLIAAGKTVEQIEVEAAAAIKAVEKGAEEINVRLINPQSAVYYVLGEVSSPGSFPVLGRETVLDGILAAGGLTDKASQCNIILSRPSLPGGCRTVMPICYRHIVQLGDTATNFQLMPGDRVYVATRTLTESLLPCLQPCPCCQGLQCPCCSPAGAMFPAATSYTSGAALSGAARPIVAPAILSETVQAIRDDE
ncbi:MAG TPA: SLBB domain-containing protein [Pirellulales bacterium]|nr:SLBB domain-containing protein [Pirellulales bacterium]